MRPVRIALLIAALGAAQAQAGVFDDDEARRQIADHRIEKPGDVLAEGDKVDVKITDVDMENQKVSLSIRALLEEAPAGEDEE